MNFTAQSCFIWLVWIGYLSSCVLSFTRFTILWRKIRRTVNIRGCVILTLHRFQFHFLTYRSFFTPNGSATLSTFPLIVEFSILVSYLPQKYLEDSVASGRNNQQKFCFTKLHLPQPQFFLQILSKRNCR